jgi:hypothetical protein
MEEYTIRMAGERSRRCGRCWMYCALLVWAMCCGGETLRGQSSASDVDLVAVENAVDALTKAVSTYDRDAERFLEKKLKPLLLDPLADSEIVGVFVERLAQIDAANLGAFPEQFGYARSVEAALRGDSLRLPFAAWDAAVERAMGARKLARDFAPLLSIGKDLLRDGVFYASKSVRWSFEGPMAISLPESGAPQFVFGPSGRLMALAKGDTLLVQRTAGAYDYGGERFEGRSGRVDWGRSGWNPSLNYADFGAYDIRLKTASFAVDSARFTTELFPDPLLGRLTDKARVRQRNDEGAATDQARYPRFDTYVNRLSMPDIVPGVDFEGGLTVRGAELQGKGSKEEPARLRFRRGDTTMVECRSALFILRANQFSGQGVEAVLRLGADSLYHPELNMRFNLQQGRLSLIRTDEGLGPRPFSDSYHKLFLDCSVLSWGLKDTRIRLEGPPGSVRSTAVLTSADFFAPDLFRDMQGIDPIHPLVRVLNHIKASGDSSFSSMSLGSSLRLSEPKTRAMMIRLAHQGYVEMDLQARTATATDKLFADLANAAGRRDFDVLFFRSENTGAGHGEISLLNGQLTLGGVARVDVSRDRGVVIEPGGGEVVIGEDRDFSFGGSVRAGNLQFEGSDFDFDYEGFSIELNAVESCKLRVNDAEEKDVRGRAKRKLVKNRLEYIQGVLRVDVPVNRSGRLSEFYPEYPVLITDEPSYVHWDDVAIENGAYAKDRFRFVVEPFTLDSLDALGRQELVFEGTLESGDLLPPLQEQLHVMDDLYLGFTTSTPAGGYQVYGGVGTFDQDLTLDGGGLQGGGRLDFRTAHAESDRFVLLPDSTKGLAQVFTNKEAAGPPPVPEVQGEGVNVLFEPRATRISARTEDVPLRIFEGESELEGGLVLGADGMTGDGTMRFSGAQLSSTLFRYNRQHILSDTAAFQLDQMVEGALAFKTDNVHCDIDFSERMGEFASNDGETMIELPANQYICYMDEFKWFMDEGEMEMTSSRAPMDDFVIDTDEASSSSNFYSTRDDQDSLNFLAPTAVYDVSEALLQCESVKFIRTADAFVEPDSGRVVVRRRAQMDPLSRAVIVANVVSRYHRLFDAEVNILGRFEYTASASVFYKDENGLEQLIKMTEVAVDTSGETVGSGTIAVQEGFGLSPFFGFSGTVNLAAAREHLAFDGAVTLEAACPETDKEQLLFSAVIDPKDVRIPIDTTLKTPMMAHLGIGAYMRDVDEPGGGPYGAFVDEIRSHKEFRILAATGELRYDKRAGIYQAGSPEKMLQPKLPGTLIEMEAGQCAVSGTGPVALPVDYGLLTQRSAGAVKVFPNGTGIEAAITAGMDFPFDDAVWKTLAERLQIWATAVPLDISGTTFEPALREWLGLEGADEVLGEMTLMGAFKKTPAAIQHRFLFTGLDLTWDPGEDAFVSSEDGIGIVSMDKVPVFRRIPGRIEWSLAGTNGILRIYLHLDDENWYFFEYRNGVMNITSKDQQFIDAITDLKDDKRRIKEGDDRFIYQILPSRSRRNEFVDRFPEFD